MKYLNTHIFAASMVAIISVPNVSIAENTDSPEKVKPVTHELTINGKSTESLISKQEELSGVTQDWIKYSEYSCDVNWNQTCEGSVTITAPQGWQVCKPLYTASKMNNGSYNVKPQNWYTNDPESPDRYRASRFYIEAKGSGRFYDQWGSTMRLTNVGIRIIRADATNNDRYAAGCHMPQHD